MVVGKIEGLISSCARTLVRIWYYGMRFCRLCSAKMFRLPSESLRAIILKFTATWELIVFGCLSIIGLVWIALNLPNPWKSMCIWTPIVLMSLYCSYLFDYKPSKRAAKLP